MKIPPVLLALVASILTVRSVAQESNYAPLTYRPAGNLGQAIVDLEMARYPQLKLITLHLTPAGTDAGEDKLRGIRCSSIGRIGKLDNQEDIEVYRAGKEVHEVDTTYNQAVPAWSVTQAPKYEVMFPMTDRSGKKVGLAVVVFGYKAGDDTTKYDAIAHHIRDDLTQRTKDKDSLLAPAP